MGVGLTADACGPTPVEEESTPPADSDGGALETAPEAEPDVFPRSTLTPPPVSEPIQPEGAAENDDGYPGPALPTASPLPEGYELPPVAPTLNPYPEATGTLIWIIKPVGEQCAETPATPPLAE